MAYFDTAKSAAATNAARPTFYQLVKTALVHAATVLPRPTKAPEDLIAAQTRAEAHRRTVDRLMR